MDIRLLRQSLMEIEDNYAKPYFENFIHHETVQAPHAIQDFRSFIIRLFGVGVYKLVGGIVKLDVIEKGIRRFERFVSFCEDIRNYSSFSRALREFYIENQDDKKKLWYGERFCNDEAEKDTIYLTQFYGMGHKNAALFLRFLCKYTNFFVEGAPSDLLVPLDRVNYRFCWNHLKDNHDLANKVPDYLEFYRNTKARDLDPERTNWMFSPRMFEQFQEIASFVMDDKKNRIVFDNIWLIGHFYCDASPRDCNIRSVIKWIDKPYIQEINFPDECPLHDFCLLKGQNL